jgi:radical SAM superfamily enzyme YgiQ (UPF0313 family)
MKVFLGNPPWRRGDRLGVRAGSRWPFTMSAKKRASIPDYVPFPFYLAYCASLLEKNGYEVNLVDAIAEGIKDEDFLVKVKDFAPHLILMETSTPSIDIDLSIAKKIKTETDSLIALAGPHVSVFGEEILRENPYIDYILIGEYEETTLDLINHLKEGDDLSNVQGIIYREGDTIRSNPRRPLIEDLDSLPWPARHLLPIYNYRDSFCQIPQPSLYIWSSRGCPYHCIFCMWPKVMYGGHKYRTRDPMKVVDEIEQEVKTYRFKSIYFDDDTFNLGKDRVIKISRLIKERRINLPWAIMARADTMDYEMLEEMASAGLFAVKYGVESGSQEILDYSGKRLDLKKVEEIVKFTKKLGIKVHLTFTFGLPKETKDTIERTIDYALWLDPDSIQFSIVTPFPGTPYFQLAKERGFLLSEEWSRYDGSNKAVIRTEELNAQDLEVACKRAYQMWYKHILLKHPLRWNYIKEGVLHPIRIFKVIRQALGI